MSDTRLAARKNASNVMLEDDADVSTDMVGRSKSRALPVIKENKLNESVYNNGSLLNSHTHANYSEIVCNTCQSSLLGVYQHCLADQDKSIPSPHHIDEIADAKRKKPPPYFELLKDPIALKNTHYKDLGEKIAKESKSRAISKQIEDMQKGAVYSMYEKLHVMDKDFSEVDDQQNKQSNFAGTLYKHTLQLKNIEIERLRTQLLEKTESEKQEVENVRKLRKALGKSMQYYIKAEEWQTAEASTLQTDIQTLKKEMSVIMACLIQAETEKKEVLQSRLRQSMKEHETVINGKDAQIADLEKQLVEIRAKLHDGLKDYIRLNEKMSTMTKQVETGTDQAESRNGVLQKNLETMTSDYYDAVAELGKSKKKLTEVEAEMEFIVFKVNELTKDKKDLTAENYNLSQELYNAQLECEKLKDVESADKIAISNLKQKLQDEEENFKRDIASRETAFKEMTKQFVDTKILKEEADGNITKLESENARLKATLKETVTKKETAESQLKDMGEFRKREALERDRMVHQLTEQVRQAQADVRNYEEKKDKALYQLNDLQSALDKEMTQNRMLMVEIERLKRDYTELKISSKNENEKLSEMKSALTNDKVMLTKHVYEVRQELKDKKEEYNNLLNEFADFKNASKNQIEELELKLSTLHKEHNELNFKYTDISNQYQSLVNVHEALTNEYHQLLQRFEDIQGVLKKTRTEYTNLNSYKDHLLKEKADMLSKIDELDKQCIKINTKMVEQQNVWATKEKEFQTTSQARESLINTLSNRANELKEDIRKSTISNNQYKEANEGLAMELDEARKEATEILRLKTILEEKLDELRKNLYNEKKIRVELERMHERLERRFTEKEAEQLKAMINRDRKMLSLDESILKENKRLCEVADLIEPKHKPQSSNK